jgi:hypothetical protein
LFSEDFTGVSEDGFSQLGFSLRDFIPERLILLVLFSDI